jgi:MFS family permease
VPVSEPTDPKPASGGFPPGPGGPSGAEALASSIRKASGRLLPFLLLLYVLAFLDRANVGFAKQALMADTGLSEAAYAFGAGLFFAGYAFLEVPSNLCLHRLGARVWMARIMVSWGLVSAAMLFAWSAPVFWTLRFLLGVAEAGFFPGVILYLTYWFPVAARARMLGWFYLGAPLALMLGGPVSGLLMEWDGRLGLRGWQWMFLVEGLAATIVGAWTYWYLPSRPGEAAWLTRAEREALQRKLEEEQEVRQARSPADLWAALRDLQVLHLAMLYLLIQMSVYGVTFYLPAQVEKLLGRPAGWTVGLVSAIPWGCALVAAWAVPRRACRTRHPQRLAAAVLLVAAGGIALSASSSPIAALLGLSLAAAGFIGVQPVFWTFPTGGLAGVAAAAGIAWINSFGAAGGFLAPNVRVWASGLAGVTEAGAYTLACTTVAGAILFRGLRPLVPQGAKARP